MAEKEKQPRIVSPYEVEASQKEWRGVEKQFINFINSRLMMREEFPLRVLVSDFKGEPDDIRHDRIRQLLETAGWSVRLTRQQVDRHESSIVYVIERKQPNARINPTDVEYRGAMPVDTVLRSQTRRVCPIYDRECGSCKGDFRECDIG